MGPSLDINRPRNVDWRRAAALLYGDWGTSKAYVIGLAFAAAGYASMPVILAVCALTALVGYNYAIVCREFPDGGGVYSAARSQSRLLASIGALLLIANFVVTAALSGWAGMSYFGMPRESVGIATVVIIAGLGAVNYFGPKHSGSLAIWMAVPTLLVVVAIIALSAPHLTDAHLQSSQEGFGKTWAAFVGVILALSGVEAIASMTGVMKLDPGASPANPRVTRTASRALLVVAIEVVLGTALLGWAALSLPETHVPQLHEHKEDMLRYLGEVYASVHLGSGFGAVFGWIVGIVFGVLLLSAVNTAIMAAIGVLFMMAQDGEFPRQFLRLNRYGVPLAPLLVATVLPMVVICVTADFQALAGKYAIGVVGAITVNLGACSLNQRLKIGWTNRGIMMATFIILLLVELTIANTNPPALVFAVSVIVLGLGVRAYSHKLSGLKTLTVTREVASVIDPQTIESLRPKVAEGQRIMVAARGVTPVLRFALEEARLRKATLCVLYVKELAVFMAAPSFEQTQTRPRWQDDSHAAAIMSLMLKLGEETGVDILPIYAVSTDPSATILDLAATLGVDYLMLGAAHRFSMVKLLKGNVVERVAAGLPEDIQLIIHG
jgi:amino acid transporter/nucleotide-binding universal stress UspA family protein